MTYQAKVVAGGKVVIPAALRREMGIATGDSLVVDRLPGGGIVLKTYAQVVKETQSAFRALLPPDYAGNMVDELIAEREADAALEDAAAAAIAGREP